MSLLAKKYQQASFKNAQFFVDTTDSDFGRRNVLNQFPLRDLPSSNDMGRKARGFNLECYVLGPSYESLRDGLIAAAENPGPGQLVHPYYGIKQVICTGCRVRETRGDLGIAYFTLSFEEAGQPAFPGQSTDALTALGAAASSAIGSSAAGFEKRFSVASAPSFVVDSAVSKVNSFADLVEQSAAKSRASTQALADFTYKIRNLKAKVRDLVATPGLLAAQMQAAIGDLVNLVPGNNKAAKSALTTTLTYGSAFDAIPLTTANRSLEDANSRALIDLVEETAVAQFAVSTAQDTYPSYDEAITARTSVTDKVDRILDETPDDDIFRDYQGLRNQTIKAVPGKTSELPNISQLQLDANTPSLVVVYDVYNDLTREDDFIARNEIRNPCFISEFRTLEVLQVERLP